MEKYIDDIRSIFPSIKVRESVDGYVFEIYNYFSETSADIGKDGSLSVYYTDYGTREQNKKFVKILERCSCELSGKDKPQYR